MAAREGLKVGDSNDYVGEPQGESWVDLQPGDRGVITGLDPHDDIVTWERIGAWAGSLEFVDVVVVDD
jgi:hypothetical protein